MPALAREILLRARRLRRFRADLTRFLDLLGVALRAGFDLAFAWDEALRAVPDGECRRFLDRVPDEGVTDSLLRVARGLPLSEGQVWFSILTHLYLSGGGLREAVEAFAETLRREEERELDRHCRELPRRANLVFLLFFFPAAALLLFLPLLLAYSNSW